MISTVIIVLVCVVTIAIIYHTLVKGEVCVCECVTGAVLSFVYQVKLVLHQLLVCQLLK